MTYLSILQKIDRVKTRPDCDKLTKVIAGLYRYIIQEDPTAIARSSCHRPVDDKLVDTIRKPHKRPLPTVTTFLRKWWNVVQSIPVMTYQLNTRIHTHARTHTHTWQSVVRLWRCGIGISCGITVWFVCHFPKCCSVSNYILWWTLLYRNLTVIRAGAIYAHAYMTLSVMNFVCIYFQLVWNRWNINFLTTVSVVTAISWCSK